MINQQRLTEKRKEPSQIVELDSISNVVSTIRKTIVDANSKIKEHNKVVKNLSQEKSDLMAQVWKYLLEAELKEPISTYKKKKNSLDKAITSLNDKIEGAKKKKNNKDCEKEDQAS